MKKISIAIMVLVVALASCKKTPEVNLKYVDVERDLITVGTTTAIVQCDYQYIATLKKAYLYYGEGENETDMNTAEMRVVQNTLYVDLAGLKENTTYSYYYEFHNGFNSMRTVARTFKTESSPVGGIMPTVVTATVTEITTNSAKGGGEVTNDGGAQVTERGICWGTNVNPTLSDNHVAAGAGTGAFTAMMDNLEANTTYHIRAYATNEAGTAYGLDREFTTNSSGETPEYVDLCLPSGTLWATCNIGANSPYEYGDYFAWGETEPKSTFTVGTYKYCNGGFYLLTKYCNDPSYGDNGFTDYLSILLPEDDAATMNKGEDWCMPTKEQWQELFDNTDQAWTTQNGVFGLLLTTNCNSLFLPAAGHYNGNNTGNVGYDIEGVGSEGFYWSSTLDTNYPITSYHYSFISNGGGMATDFRYSGQTIRPVRKTNSPTPPGNVPEGAINGLFTINESGDQVYFSQGNLQYQASTDTWRFAENQWDYVGTQVPDQWGYAGGTVEGSDNENISETYNGWIDLFGWGTSGWANGNIYFHPWDSDWENMHSEGYGPTDGMNYQFDLTGTYANADWGVYNCISNGGNQINQWRTLTNEEWFYILNIRTTLSGNRYAKAQVNNVNGIIILPDNWNSSVYYLNNINDNGACYNSNVISNSGWTILESNGSVFLPASGHRWGTEVTHVCVYGKYWSSSCYYEYAWFVGFGDGGLEITTDDSRALGQSVRLVQDTNH